MKIPNLREMIWFSPPDMGGENISSIMFRYMSFIGWRQGSNPCLIYAGSESQLENAIEAKKTYPHLPLILNFWGWMPERFMELKWRIHYYKKLELIDKNVDVITVPNSRVAEDLRMLGISARIDIRPPGVDTIGLLLAKAEATRYLRCAPFILSIGRLVPHKNFQAVIAALQGTNYRYIIIGKGEYKETLEKLAKEKNVDLVIAENASDSTKGEMIALACGVIVPSSYEGFGLPIVESSTINTPVIASDISAFRELFGDNIEYFTGEESLKSKIKMLMENQDYRETLITKQALLALRYSGFSQSIRLDTLFREIVATKLKDVMREEVNKNNNSLADAYNFDALIDKEYFKYRLDHNNPLFAFRIEPLLTNVTGKTVLDIGSSTGVFAIHLGQAGYDVTSIDISAEYLNIVDTLIENLNLEDKVKTQLCDVEKLDLSFEASSFDNVWAGEIIEHFTDTTLLIKQLMRVVKPKGRILLTVPYKDACHDAFHMKEFNTEDDIKAIFKDFPEFEFKEIKRIGSQGGSHNNWFAWGIKNP